jgi:protease-4
VEPLKPEHEERIRAWMEQTYSTFKEGVAQGRELTPDRVEEIARGRIWSGTDAVEIGLVDRTGGVDTALALARELAGLPAEAGVRVFPRPKTFFEALSESELPFPVSLGAQRLVDLHGPLPRLNREALEDLARPRPWVLMPPVNVD